MRLNSSILLHISMHKSLLILTNFWTFLEHKINNNKINFEDLLTGPMASTSRNMDMDEQTGEQAKRVRSNPEGNSGFASTSRAAQPQMEAKRVFNPQANRWNQAQTMATISENGQTATATGYFQSVYAVQGFLLAGLQHRADNFLGTILYYYEVTGTEDFSMGLSDGNIPGEDSEEPTCIGTPTNSYAFWSDITQCLLQGRVHKFEWPIGTIQPELKMQEEETDVLGCGLVLTPNDHQFIFFTLNGQLVGQKIRIESTVDHLLPTVTLSYDMSVQANFAGPFEYNIDECPGLVLD